MTSEDIYCRICGESWNIHGIFHGDMTDKEINLFLNGLGCSCCAKGRVKVVMDELVKEVANKIVDINIGR